MNRARLMNLAAAMMFGLAAVLLVLAGARWIAHRPEFDFRRAEVQGELQHVTAASVRAAIAGRLKGNYFTMRLDDTRRLLETVPWVAQASVRRVWPNRLQITLREHRALGAWADGRLLSDRGELFVANVAEAEVFGPLPSFDGPDDEARQVAERYYEFAATLAPIALAVDSIDVSDRHSWSLVASGPGVAATTMALGRDDTPGAVQRRLGDVVAAYPMVVARVGGPPAQIDARYANGLAASAPRSSDPRAR
ncbi:MAG TPA: FtsQ-type POTRA domain-containing protein [Burkholderiaceae bacterium]|nr:FtsQ-type POTRA domain-containing protein [Burkholderiaceae bacterium]